MNKKYNLFYNNNYKHISNFVKSKIKELRNIEDFNNVSIKNTNLENKLELSLNKEQKNIFEDYIKSIYELEEFYFAFAYSLGVKYGEDLEKL